MALKKNKKVLFVHHQRLEENKLRSIFLFEGSRYQQTKRALPIAAAVADAVELVGTGIMFGASDDCGIMGIFGFCQEKAQKAQTIAKNIEKWKEYAIAIGDNLQDLANATDENFFRVSKDFAFLHEVPNQFIETRNENGQKIEKQFQVFREKIYDMHNCNQHNSR